MCKTVYSGSPDASGRKMPLKLEPLQVRGFLFVIASQYQAKLSCLTKEESKPLLMRFLPLVEMTLFS